MTSSADPGHPARIEPPRRVSYAQNFEDVMLLRALQDVALGLYIDVGAQDPIVDSVSLAFHERGWRGIHVEPSAAYAGRLRSHRPGDVVIQAAVGGDGRAAIVPWFEIADTGLSTLDAEIAERHRRRGFASFEATTPVVPLSAVFAQVGEGPVHWLKVDVEGAERQALASWGDAPTRPWIVVVEAIVPLSAEPTDAQWERELLDRGYLFAYFDGLNRFYVRSDQSRRLEHFKVPPNIFDGFALNGSASAPFHRVIVERHEARVSELKERHEAERRQLEDVHRLRLEQMTREHAADVAELERGSAARQLGFERRCEDLQHRLDAQAAAGACDRLEARAQLLAEREARQRDATAAISRERVASEEAASLREDLRSARAALAEAEREAAAWRLQHEALRLESRARLRNLKSRLRRRDAELHALRGSAWRRMGAAFHRPAASAARPGLSVASPPQAAAAAIDVASTATAATTRSAQPLATMTDERPTRFSFRHVDELFDFYDEDFVWHAYLGLLSRTPDPAGFTAYLTQLRAGVDKRSLIAALVQSDEGREKAADRLPGVAQLVDAERRRRPSGLRRVVRSLLAPALEPLQTRLCSLETQLYRNARTQHHVARWLDERLASGTGSGGARATGFDPRDPGFGNMTEHARDLHLQLRDAAARKALLRLP